MAVVALPDQRIVRAHEQQLVLFNQALAARAQLPLPFSEHHLRTVRQPDRVLAVLNETSQEPLTQIAAHLVDNIYS